RRDLRDLVGAMHLRVLRVGLELGQRPGLDPLGGEAQRHGRVVSVDEWIPAGVRIPGATLDSTRGPAASGVSSPEAGVHWGSRGSRVAPVSGWLPKNPALTLAKCRAKPASIRRSRG